VIHIDRSGSLTAPGLGVHDQTADARARDRVGELRGLRVEQTVRSGLALDRPLGHPKVTVGARAALRTSSYRTQRTTHAGRRGAAAMTASAPS